MNYNCITYTLTLISHSSQAWGKSSLALVDYRQQMIGTLINARKKKKRGGDSDYDT